MFGCVCCTHSLSSSTPLLIDASIPSLVETKVPTPISTRPSSHKRQPFTLIFFEVGQVEEIRHSEPRR